jgi:methionyl aminopeptidase
VRIPDVGAAI